MVHVSDKCKTTVTFKCIYIYKFGKISKMTSTWTNGTVPLLGDLLIFWTGWGFTLPSLAVVETAEEITKAVDILLWNVFLARVDIAVIVPIIFLSSS
jgi:hypothetical protein